jgi:hypothetical protein
VSSTRAPHTHLECDCGRRMLIAYVDLVARHTERRAPITLRFVFPHQRLYRRRRRELDSRAAYAPRSCRGRHMRIAYVLPRGCCPWRQAPHRCIAAAIRCREGRISLTSHRETTSSFSVPWAAMASGPTRSDSRISLSPSHRGVPEAHRRALPIHVDPLHAPQISNRGGNQGSIITAPSSSLSTSRSASGIPPSRVGRHLGRASCPALQVVAPAGYRSLPRRQASESYLVCSLA